jgi:DNA-directed RNA polymerase subunit RPC12/RpoP
MKCRHAFWVDYGTISDGDILKKQCIFCHQEVAVYIKITEEKTVRCLRCGATVTEIEQLEEGPVEYNGQRGFLCYKCTDELLDEVDK